MFKQKYINCRIIVRFSSRSPNIAKCAGAFILGAGWDWSAYLATLSFLVFFVALAGILLERNVAVRIILLFEVCLASIISYTISLSSSIGSLAVVIAVVFLVIAAVETILLFGFVVLIHHLNQVSDISKLNYLQS